MQKCGYCEEAFEQSIFVVEGFCTDECADAEAHRYAVC